MVVSIRYTFGCGLVLGEVHLERPPNTGISLMGIERWTLLISVAENTAANFLLINHLQSYIFRTNVLKED